jgi:hypothetical protein
MTLTMLADPLLDPAWRDPVGASSRRSQTIPDPLG